MADLPRESPHTTDVQEILNAANRASSLTRQLLAFSRRQVLQPNVLDLNALTGNLEKMLRRLLREDIQLVTRFDPQLALVNADAGQLEQVIVNLVVNARDAMPRGGRISIETSNVMLGEGYGPMHANAAPGPYVLLSVSDTGKGMDKATQAHIFEPFFTTKPVGQGTGLGLSTVYGIVKQSGGYVWVYSEIDRGTTFKIYLPAVVGAPNADEASARRRHEPHRRPGAHSARRGRAERAPHRATHSRAQRLYGARGIERRSRRSASWSGVRSRSRSCSRISSCRRWAVASWRRDFAS